jgi:hypothetical protein
MASVIPSATRSSKKNKECVSSHADILLDIFIKNRFMNSKKLSVQLSGSEILTALHGTGQDRKRNVDWKGYLKLHIPSASA